MKSTSKKRTPSIVNLTVKRSYLTQRPAISTDLAISPFRHYGDWEGDRRRAIDRAQGTHGHARPIHPHMLRHACGFKLANDGHDTRALQHSLGHKNIQHTVRYTDMAPDRSRWRRASNTQMSATL